MGLPRNTTLNHTAPTVIVFDVNETLSDLSPLKDRFVQVGAPEHLSALWFSLVLRDGFALAASGGASPFSVIGGEILCRVLRDTALNRSLDDAVAHILAGFAALTLHSDIRSGIMALKNENFRLVTLSNGSAQVARSLLGSAGLDREFDLLLTVDDAPAWKPVDAAYRYAADICAVTPAELLLVAVHPWDLHGAAQAGLQTAWLNRNGDVYPSYFTAPDYTVTVLSELAALLRPGSPIPALSDGGDTAGRS